MLFLLVSIIACGSVAAGTVGWQLARGVPAAVTGFIFTTLFAGALPVLFGEVGEVPVALVVGLLAGVIPAAVGALVAKIARERGRGD